MTYSLIAPLVLGFATVAIAFFYLAYRYNVLFVSDNTIDTKGLMYPRALQHLLTGVYLGEICMIGLFSISAAIGPIILMVVALIGTILFHVAMNSALDPLLYNLPKSLAAELGSFPLENDTGTQTSGTAAFDGEKIAGESAPPATTNKKSSLLGKFLKPDIYDNNYATLSCLVRGIETPTPTYSPEVERAAYLPPSVKSATPTLWIPCDDMGISRQEIADTAKVIPITDKGAALDKKGNVSWDARAPIREEKTNY